MAIGTPVLIGTNNSLSSNSILTVTVGVSGVPQGADIFVLWGGGEPGTSFVYIDGQANSSDEPLSDDAHATGNVETHFFHARASAALVSGDAISVDWTTNVASKSMIAWYVEGLAATSAQSGTPVIAEASSATPDSGSITTADADAIIFGLVSWQDAGVTTVTEDGDFTGLSTTDEAATNNVLHVAYRIVTATELNNYAPGLSVSSAWHCGIAAYKAAITGATVIPVAGTAGHTVAAGGMAQINSLLAVATSQGHTVAAGALAQANTLIGVSGTQGHTVTVGALVQNFTAIPVPSLTGHNIAAGGMLQNHIARTVNAITGHTADIVELALPASITVVNPVTGHTAEVGVIQVFVPGQSSPSRIYTVLEDGRVYEVLPRNETLH